MYEINVIKHRIQICFNKIYNLKVFLDYENKNIKLSEINRELKLCQSWENSNLIIKLNQEKGILTSLINSIDRAESDLRMITEILELSIKEKNSNLLCDIVDELNIIEVTIKKLELNYFFSNKHDRLNCYLDIQSGSGGTDAQDWANMLFRMYVKWSCYKNFKIEIIEKTHGEIVGIKSATIQILGKYAFGWLRTETGIHRLVRKSPFSSNNQRHTSFASVFVYPDIDNTVQIKINSCDLRIDVYRASGAGGQHVNKTESAVRVTHIPSGLVTQSQSSRSQHKNKNIALRQLKSKLYKMTMNKIKSEKQILEIQKSDIGWGNQIRSYILDSSRIKDLRTGVEVSNTQSILDGFLDIFIESSLRHGL
ncbi:peptide chain release factor 2 [Buchnera aphidicola]|uniref:peptide chain release factor 2 n=1 Tax=Buchnera aphidicola TaxID=9 RepID=UPI0012ABFCAF|nr:peptide chain release factor 2 [Buchnera aphidicola]